MHQSYLQCGSVPNVATRLTAWMTHAQMRTYRGLWAGLGEFPGNGQETSSRANPEYLSRVTEDRSHQKK